MFIISNLLSATADVLHFALSIYMWIMVARAVLSWVNPDPYNPIVRFIQSVTEPVLSIVRAKVPSRFGGLDLSPIIVFLAIIFLDKFLVQSLHGLSMAFR